MTLKTFNVDSGVYVKFLEKLARIRKGKFIRVKSFAERYGL